MNRQMHRHTKEVQEKVLAICQATARYQCRRIAPLALRLRLSIIVIVIVNGASLIFRGLARCGVASAAQ